MINTFLLVTEFVVVIVGSLGIHELAHFLVAKVHGYHPYFSHDGLDPCIVIEDHGFSGTSRGFIRIVIAGGIAQTLFLMFTLWFICNQLDHRLALIMTFVVAPLCIPCSTGDMLLLKHRKELEPVE